MKIHEVEIIHTDESHLYVKVDTQLYRILWQQCSAKLSRATLEERSLIRVSPSGYGLHWSLIDEDLAVDPLVAIAEKLAVLPAMATVDLVGM